MPETFAPVLINLPVEIDAGEFFTQMTVQGETVKYNKVHVPLEYTTVSGDVTYSQMAQAIVYKEDAADQTKVIVDLSGGAIGTHTNGKAVIKALFKKALEGSTLKSLDISGVVYADNTARNTATDAVKFYVNKDTHKSGLLTDLSGANLAGYLREYLYDNLSAAIGLAATTGEINITLNRQYGDISGAAASEIIADMLAKKLAGEALGTETDAETVGKALRQNIYEQMFVLAPERFKETNLMRKAGEPATDDKYTSLPFQVNDTLAFLVTFKFPGKNISAPVLQHALTTTQQTYTATGDKITVTTPSSNTLLPGTTGNYILNDFPNCTVMMRAKLAQ
jgi:hypothetical protein